MKKILTLIFTMMALSLFSQQTNLFTVDLYTVHPTVTVNPYLVWLTETNGAIFGTTTQSYFHVSGANMTVVNSNAYITGDTPLVYNQKYGSNFVFVQNEILNNNSWVKSNVPVFSYAGVVYNTNLFASSSNNLGGVSSFSSYNLTQVTNYTPLVLWASYTTNAPFAYSSPWFQVTSGLTPNTPVILELAGQTNGVGIFGNPAVLVVNTTNYFTILTPGPTNFIGGFTNVSSWSLSQTNSYTPVSLYGSYAGDSAVFTFTNGTVNGDYISISSASTVFQFTNSPTYATDVLTNTSAAKSATNFFLNVKNYFPSSGINGSSVTVAPLTPAAIVSSSLCATSSIIPASFWAIYPGFSSTGSVYLKLQGDVNSGSFSSLTVYGVTNPQLFGKTNQFYGQDFHMRNLSLDGNLNFFGLINGVTLSQLLSGGNGITNSYLPIGTNVSVVPTTTTFDPATVNYFSFGGVTNISTNYSAFSSYSFTSYLNNYFAFNPLPKGAKFTTSIIAAFLASGEFDYSMTNQIANSLSVNNPVNDQYSTDRNGAVGTIYLYTVYLPSSTSVSAKITPPSVPLQSLNAVNNLVLSLKSSGLWNICTNGAVYPFAAQTAVGDSVNLVGTNYFITWTNSLTNASSHIVSGVLNTNGWGDTHFNQPNYTNQTLIAFAFGENANQWIISGYDNTNQTAIYVSVSSNLVSAGISSTNLPSIGFKFNQYGNFYSVSQTNNSSQYGLIDGVSFSNSISCVARPASNIVLFAQSPGTLISSGMGLGFAAIVPSLTPAQLAAFQSIVYQYELDMGRISGLVSTNTLPTITFTGCSISYSNDWATSVYNATNNLSPGSFAFGVNSNGMGTWKIWNSNGVFYFYSQ